MRGSRQVGGIGVGHILEDGTQLRRSVHGGELTGVENGERWGGGGGYDDATVQDLILQATKMARWDFCYTVSTVEVKHVTGESLYYGIRYYILHPEMGASVGGPCTCVSHDLASSLLHPFSLSAFHFSPFSRNAALALALSVFLDGILAPPPMTLSRSKTEVERALAVGNTRQDEAIERRCRQEEGHNTQRTTDGVFSAHEDVRVEPGPGYLAAVDSLRDCAQTSGLAAILNASLWRVLSTVTADVVVFNPGSPAVGTEQCQESHCPIATYLLSNKMHFTSVALLSATFLGLASALPNDKRQGEGLVPPVNCVDIPAYEKCVSVSPEANAICAIPGEPSAECLELCGGCCGVQLAQMYSCLTMP
nr:hypothetical protein CFP56_31741 [Quercus suber]